MNSTEDTPQAGPTAGTLPLRLARFFGVDRAVAFTLLGRGWGIAAGLINLMLIARYLSMVQQGYFYTFGNILGLQIFFDLGIAYVVLQFAAHEKAELDWSDDGTLQGDPIAKSRLASLLRVALTWYCVSAVLFLGGVLVAGLYFFRTPAHHAVAGPPVLWQLPWVCIVCVSATALTVAPLFSVLSGCGLVAEVARVTLGAGIVASATFWALLAWGAGLMASPLSAAASLAWGIMWLWKRKRVCLVDLLRNRPPPPRAVIEAGANEAPAGRDATINWRYEVWPFQWKIAVSWLSSYFVFQLFNPVLFKYFGPAAAGRMGMSLSLVQALMATAMAWTETKAAPFGNLIARKEYAALDKLFFLTLWRSFAIVATGGGVIWCATFYLHASRNRLSHRLLDPLPLGLLIAATVTNHIYFAEAVYLRAHKREPYLGTSVVGGCLIGLSTFFLGRQYGPTGMAAGYFAVSLFFWLPAATFIFFAKRREWHRPEDAQPAIL